MTVEGLLLLVDRLAGGRHARYRVPDAARDDPAVRRGFGVVTALLTVVLLLGAAALAQAVHLQRSGAAVSLVVWWRLVVIFGITATLFFFVWRARAGFYWAYSRLRLFSFVFPVIALTTCLIPGLYPGWMVEEQIAVSLVLLVIGWLLSRGPMRRAYPRPARTASGPTLTSPGR